MKIALLSDIHDHIAKLAAALDRVRDAEALICCGDLCSPFIARQLGEGFAGPIHVVFGNNDGDLFRISAMAARFPQITLHGELARLELGGCRIAVNHYPEIAGSIAESRAFDLVCYGHNHLYAVERRADTLLVNPGEVMGELTGAATCAVYDTITQAVTRHDF